MDHKALKSDLTYALKKFSKEGKTITCDALSNNLEFVDGQIALSGEQVDVLEALVLIKGYKYTPIQYVEKWTDPAGLEHEYKWWHHEAFGIPVSDLIAEQGQIAKTDLYDFMDGLENVAGSDKSEFYKVGVYIREKFTPVGVRTETLQKARYQEKTVMETVRRFIVHNRPMPGCRKTGLPSIVEVECEVFMPVLAAPGEFAARILKPEWLWEPTRVLQEGVLKDVNMPPVYCFHSVFETIEQAREAALRQIRSGFEFELRKGRIDSYTSVDVEGKMSEVQELKLS